MTMPTTKTNNTTSRVLALDVGERRVGMASADLVARLPQPLTTLERDEYFWDKLQELLTDTDTAAVVVGLPRSLDGNDTAQTLVTRQFIAKLQTMTELPIYIQDEAVTSRQAESELQKRGKPYTKSDVDALAATYILEDYLRESRSKA